MAIIRGLNQNFTEFIIYLAIYSFLGWCAEVAYAYKNQRKFVNRGFLKGPVCPIYGYCILAMVSIFENFSGSIVILYLMATISTSTIEYFTGLILEKVFKKKYWDYTDDPLNFQGRVCLHFSLMWGLGVLLIVKYIHPFIGRTMVYMDYRIFESVGFIILIILILDFSLTVVSLIDRKRFQLNIQLCSVILLEKSQYLFESSKERLSYVIKTKGKL